MRLIITDVKETQPTDLKNTGAKITRTQQVKVLCSTSVAAFTVIGKLESISVGSHLERFELIIPGFTLSFGVFQAHYTREHSAREGVVRHNELQYRALVSAIGSLGNGGIVAVFAVFYYPWLTRIGAHVRYLCLIGTMCVAVGFATAAASHSVSAFVLS
jgi:hypothetical protein